MNDLESDDAPAGADDPPPPPPPADPPAPPADPDEQEPEGAVDVAGQKMVPVGALIEERKQRKVIKEQLATVTAHVNQIRPYLDFLAANPGLMDQTRQTRSDAAPPPADAPVDEAAVEMATTLDLYNAEGKPDVKRAQKIIAFINRTSKANAQEEVKPERESRAKAAADYMYNRALATRAPDGRTADRDVLDALWLKTDPAILATEEGAAGVVAMAMGLTAMRGTARPLAAPAAAPPAAAPLYTDPAGSRDTKPRPMSALEEGIAKLRGMDTKTYAERTRGFNPGRPSQLED